MDLFAKSSECASVTYLDLGFETRWISFGLVCYAKTIKATIQISCTTSFIDSILWWTDVYNNLFQIMQLSKLNQSDFYSVKTSRVPS